MKTLAPLPAAPGPLLQQSAQFAAALTLMGRQPRQLVLTGAEGAPLAEAVALPVPGVGGLSLFGGPHWLRTPSKPERAEAFAQLRAAHVWLISPGIDPSPRHMPIPRALRIMTPAHMARLALTSDWRAAAHVKWRNRLTRAEAEQQSRGVTVQQRPFEASRDAWLLRASATQAREKRYRAYPPALVPAYAEAAPGDVQLFTARQAGRVIAAIVTLCHGSSATYHLAWGLPEAREVDAHRLLLAQAVAHLRARGVAHLDLGLIDTGAAPGLARFKLGSGAQLHALGGTWLTLPWRGRGADAPAPARNLPDCG